MIAPAIHTPLEKVRVLQRKLYRVAKADSQRKFGVLYDKVYRADVLHLAWLMVCRNAGAAGVDDLSIKQIKEEIGAGKFLIGIRDKLKAKAYRPMPVRRVYIPKANGGERPLGIPTITDRVVQTAVKLVIEPIFEADFKDFSYGFRPKRNAHMALREIYKYLNFGCHQVVDADLKAYFDTIPQDKLMVSVRQRVSDKGILKLIELWLNAGVMEDMAVKKQLTGTPQGGVISPLLANLYLHWLDKVWEKSGFNERRHDAHLVRYADDFVIVCKRDPNKYLGEAKRVLDRLGLTLNEDKTRVVDVTQERFDFLGHTFAVQPSKRNGELKSFYYPSGKAMKSVKKRLREVISKGQHVALPKLIGERVNPILRGWAGYFKTGNARNHFKSIDNYTIWTLCIMLRKKYKKSGKGWRDHPPSWFHEYHDLFSMNRQTVVGELSVRYGR